MAFRELDKKQFRVFGKPSSAVIEVTHHVLDANGNIVACAGRQITSDNHFEIDGEPLIMLPYRDIKIAE